MARPTFRPTLEQRHWIASAAGAGWSYDVMARGLGIDRGTLATHFAHELGAGRARRRMDIINAMFVAALGGNVSAMKWILARTPQATRDNDFDKGDRRWAS